MTEYQAKSNNYLFFEVTKADQLIGKLSYKSWFKFNAEVDIANAASYVVEPKGFWGTTIELKEGENVLLNFKMNWNGDIVIHTHFSGVDKDYVFKHRGFFKESFILVDHEGIELLVMKPNLKWNKMNYEYQMVTSDNFETLAKKEILLITSVHCANYYMSMMMSAMGPGS